MKVQSITANNYHQKSGFGAITVDPNIPNKKKLGQSLYKFLRDEATACAKSEMRKSGAEIPEGFSLLNGIKKKGNTITLLKNTYHINSNEKVGLMLAADCFRNETSKYPRLYELIKMRVKKILQNAKNH